MQKKVVLLLLVSLGICTSGFGQSKRVLSLQDCVQLALKNNSQLRNARRNADLAATNVVTMRSNVLPRINSSFSAGQFEQGPRVRLQDVPKWPPEIDPVTRRLVYEQREIVQEKVTRHSYGATVRLTYNLFDFGQSWFRISQAKASALASEDDYDATRQSVVSDVRQKYYELLKALKLVEVYEKAVEAAERQLQRTEAMYELGSVAQADVYKARVNLGQNQINLITQRNTVEIAKANLNTVMGREPTEPLEIMDIDLVQKPLPYTFEEAAKRALEKNPDVLASKSRVRASRIGVRVAKTNFLPSIGLSVSYSRDNEFLNRVITKDLNRDYSMTFGVSVDFNIFNGLSDKAELDRQYTNQRITEENLQNTERNVLAEVKRAFLNLQAYREIAKINEDNLKSAEEDLRLAEERYRIGSGTLLEVIDAQVALTRARATFVSSRYDALIARTQLEAAIGELSG